MATRKAADSPIMQTTDYERFKLMEGNRNVDPLHVKRLKKLMTENGNLTQDYPIMVNANFEILDGQHRYTALKELGWKVFYQVRTSMNLGMVRAINIGNKNWTWYDFAQSYAKLGNNNYIRFVLLADEFPQFGYGVLSRFTNMKDRRSAMGKGGRVFRQGDLVLTAEQYQQAKERLNQYLEVAELLPKSTGTYAEAFYLVLQSPYYDHKVMLAKLEKFGSRVFNKAWVGLTLTDALRAFEEVYNFHNRDGEEKRLY